MIKINLVAERKAKGPKTSPGPAAVPGGDGTRNLLLVGSVLLGVLVSAGWWWSQTSQRTRLQHDIREAEQE